MVMFPLIKKEKDIAVIINASDFYFGHFGENEDISQKFMLSFSSQI